MPENAPAPDNSWGEQARAVITAKATEAQGKFDALVESVRGEVFDIEVGSNRVPLRVRKLPQQRILEVQRIMFRVQRLRRDDELSLEAEAEFHRFLNEFFENVAAALVPLDGEAAITAQRFHEHPYGLDLASAIMEAIGDATLARRKAAATFRDK